MPVMNGLAVTIGGDTADPVRGLNDLYPSLGQRSRCSLGASSLPRAVRHSLGFGMQDHRMKSVPAVDRQQPICLPHLRRHSKPQELISVIKLFRNFVGQGRWRKLRCITKVSPDVSPQLLGRVGTRMDLIQARTIIGLPRYQHALSAAVKAQAVQRALKLSF